MGTRPNKKHHIAWLAHYVPYPPIGGVLQRGYHLLAEVSRYLDVTLIAFNQRRHLGNEASLREAVGALSQFCRNIQVHEIPSDRSRFRWYSLVMSSTLTRLPYTARWTLSPSVDRGVSQLLHKSHIRMVHFDTIGLAEYLPATQGIPSAVNHHNIESHMMQRRIRYESNFLKRLYFRAEARKLLRYEKTMCPLFKQNLTVSEVDRSHLLSLIPELKVEVIPNGTDINYFQPTMTGSDTGGLIFVGGLSWYPNRDAVLYFCEHVWPRIRKENQRVTVTIIGRDPPRRLQRLAANDERIKLLGFVGDIRQHMRNAAVYVCPIRDGGGTRLKILDALAMGKAVVASGMACEGLEVSDGQHLLIADTPEQFCNAVLKILDRPELQRRLGYEGRLLVEERYSWQAIGRRLAALYDRVIAAS